MRSLFDRYVIAAVEPVGGTKPQFSSKMDQFGFQERSETAVALVCPAQSHPTPSYRFGTVFFLATIIPALGPRSPFLVNLEGTALNK